MSRINNDWDVALLDEMKEEYFIEMMEKIKKERMFNDIFPEEEDVFNALKHTPLNKVKVVIIGQDPYHDIGQAHGLCFSVKKGVKIPPSLKNIYKELENDLGIISPDNGYLINWAEQGVLMLNNVLTVRAHEANSHKSYGWERFTDKIIEIVGNEDRPIVFLLWGKPAQTKCKKIKNKKHLILTSSHPSPLSAYRGFLGCGHFSKANEFLKENNMEPINWQI